MPIAATTGLIIGLSIGVVGWTKVGVLGALICYEANKNYKVVPLKEKEINDDWVIV